MKSCQIGRLLTLTLTLVYKGMNIKEVPTMSGLDKPTQFSGSPIIRFWQRIPVLVRAIVSGAFCLEKLRVPNFEDI